MFKYKISTLEASDKLCEYWATKCISLLSPEYQDVYRSTPKRLVVYFDDIDREPRQPSRYVAPKIDQIRQVLQFSKSLNDSDRLLVHCKAGISRSTAMLIGILCQHGLEPEIAFKSVQKVRPQLWPNDLIINYCDQILDLNSSLINVIASFKKQQKHRLFVPEGYVSLIREHMETIHSHRKDRGE